MAVRGLPRLIRLNRRLSWLLALLSAVVLLTGYGLTILDVEGAAASGVPEFVFLRTRPTPAEVAAELHPAAGRDPEAGVAASARHVLSP